MQRANRNGSSDLVCPQIYHITSGSQRPVSYSFSSTDITSIRNSTGSCSIALSDILRDSSNILVRSTLRAMCVLLLAQITRKSKANVTIQNMRCTSEYSKLDDAKLQVCLSQKPLQALI